MMASNQVMDELYTPVDFVPSVPMQLRQDQLFRHLSDSVLQELSRSVEIITVLKGHSVNNAHLYGVCTVRKGTIEVHISKTARQAQPVFRTLVERDSLLPMLSILVELVRWRDGISNVSSHIRQVHPLSELSSMNFVASEDSEMIAVTLDNWQKFLTANQASALSITREIFRRLYFSTIPVARKYFGLDQHIYEFLSGITQPFRRPFEDGVFSLSLVTTWLEALRVLEGNSGRSRSHGGFTIGLDSAAITNLQQTESKTFAPTLSRNSTGLSGRSFSSSGRELTRLQVSMEPFLDLPQPESPTASPMTTFEKRSFSLRKPASKRSLRSVSTRTVDLDDLPNAIREQSGRHILLALGFLNDDLKGVLAASRLDPNGATDASTSQARTSDETELQDILRHCIDAIQVVYFSEVSTLIQKGERYAGVYYILTGGFDVHTPKELAASAAPSIIGKSPTVHGQINPGDIVGYHSLLDHNTSMYDIIARADSYICVLPREMIRVLTSTYPLVLHTMARRVVETLPSLLRLVDFAIDWTPYTTGETIKRRGSSLSVVLKGRCRMKLSDSRGQEEELQKGDCFGVQQLFADDETMTTSYAIRPSEIAHIQFGTYQALSLLEPQVALSLAKIGAMSSARTIYNRWTETEMADTPPPRPDFHTLTVLPLSPDVPVGEFATELMRAIIDTGIKSERKVAILESQQMMGVFGVSHIDEIGILEVDIYLAQLEDVVDLLIFVGDADAHSSWNGRCISHADSIMLAANANHPPELTHMDDLLLMMRPRCRTDLVLIHYGKERICPFGVPHAWLENRTWINSGHHHVLLRQEDASYEDHARPPPRPLKHKSADFHRLARLLFGKAIALVLSGGGARGLAHLGFIRALEESGIPVDIVGGTSMGACVGGIYARELGWESTEAEMRKLAAQFRFWRAVPDMTYPHVAGTTGAAFQAMVRKSYGDKRIEELWLGYYCAVTNLSKNGPQTQSYGDATRSIVASMSYPGLVPPTCVDGELLLDGCFTSNLPVNRAQMLGASTIFVVDVSPIEPLDRYEYGHTISGWKILLDRINPTRKGGDPIPPTMDDILARLTLSPSIAEVEAIKRSPNCRYISLPVGQYSALAFDKFDELVRVSYKYSTQWLRQNVGSGGPKPEVDEESIV